MSVHDKFTIFNSWINNHALPFWYREGFDEARNIFVEKTDFNGNPIHNVPHRTMVQGRQIYVYSHATLLGLNDYSEKAILAADNLIKYYFKVDGFDGWVFSINRDGSVIDNTRDTYAHAFAIFGLSWAYRLCNKKVYKSVVDETLDYLDQKLSSDRGGFYDCFLRNDIIRKQNPHMHLFEALLSWYEVTNDEKYLARAGEIFGVFTTSFYQPDSSILAEYFDNNWAPLQGVKGRIFEPGHHMEWVWLLLKYHKYSSRDVSLFVHPLFNKAKSLGYNSQGEIYDEILSDGTVYNGSNRCWPHTEAIKACVAMKEIYNTEIEDLIEINLTTLIRKFIAVPFVGGWIDHYTEKGDIKVNSVPASSLYHIFLAYAELRRFISL